MGGVLNAASQREHIASLHGTLQNCTSMREIRALILQEQAQAKSAGLYQICNWWHAVCPSRTGVPFLSSKWVPIALSTAGTKTSLVFGLWPGSTAQHTSQLPLSKPTPGWLRLCPQLYEHSTSQLQRWKPRPAPCVQGANSAFLHLEYLGAHKPLWLSCFWTNLSPPQMTTGSINSQFIHFKCLLGRGLTAVAILKNSYHIMFCTKLP